MIIHQLQQTLQALAEVIKTLNKQQYTQPISRISNATIGQHVRHCIEFVQCLETGAAQGLICYDKRKRDPLIEESPEFALENINRLIKELPTECNVKLQLSQKYNSTFISCDTTYERELIFNIEHIVHHQALIKIAIEAMDLAVNSDTFGVSTSTIEYRKNVYTDHLQGK